MDAPTCKLVYASALCCARLATNIAFCMNAQIHGTRQGARRHSCGRRTSRTTAASCGPTCAWSRCISRAHMPAALLGQKALASQLRKVHKNEICVFTVDELVLEALP